MVDKIERFRKIKENREQFTVRIIHMSSIVNYLDEGIRGATARKEAELLVGSPELLSVVDDKLGDDAFQNQTPRM
mgnify:CR=1 FL=1